MEKKGDFHLGIPRCQNDQIREAYGTGNHGLLCFARRTFTSVCKSRFVCLGCQRFLNGSTLYVTDILIILFEFNCIKRSHISTYKTCMSYNMHCSTNITDSILISLLY